VCFISKKNLFRLMFNLQWEKNIFYFFPKYANNYWVENSLSGWLPRIFINLDKPKLPTKANKIFHICAFSTKNIAILLKSCYTTLFLSCMLKCFVFIRVFYPPLSPFMNFCWKKGGKLSEKCHNFQSPTGSPPGHSKERDAPPPPSAACFSINMFMNGRDIIS
jgi:hypothetical protein